MAKVYEASYMVYGATYMGDAIPSMKDDGGFCAGVLDIDARFRIYRVIQP